MYVPRPKRVAREVSSSCPLFFRDSHLHGSPLCCPGNNHHWLEPIELTILYPSVVVLAHKIDFRHLQRLDNGKIGMSPPTWPLAWYVGPHERFICDNLVLYALDYILIVLQVPQNAT